MINTCFQKGIAIYSPHTTWDAVNGGVTDWLASAIKSSDLKPIVPVNETEGCKIGAGRIGTADKPIPLRQVIEDVKALTGCKTVNVAQGVDCNIEMLIKKFAVCAGSGGSVLKGVEADLFITGGLKIIH